MIREARKILTTYEPMLARVLSDALLASWLAGGKSLLDRLPPAPEPPAALFPGPPAEPPLPPDFLPPAPGEEPIIHFPVIEEAARDLAARQVVTRPVFDALAEDAKRAAFTVARVGSEDALAKIQDLLTQDVAQGGTLREFRRAVEETLDGSALSRPHIENVYRTNISVAYAKGQDAISQHPLVAEEFPYRKETSVNDSRRTPLCKAISHAGLDGTGVFRADDPVWLHFRSPRHWQCLLPGTPVEGEFLAGVRSFYRGKAVEIVTAGGSVVRVTENHPVLTKNGWVAAGAVKKGDQLFRHMRRGKLGWVTLPVLKREGAAEINSQPAMIEEVFGLLAASGCKESSRVQATDFHGDGQFIQGNVDVVWSDPKLRCNREAGFPDHGGNLVLETAPTSVVSGVGLALPLLRGGTIPLQTLRFGSTADFDARFLQAAVENHPFDASTDRDGFQGLAGFVGGNEAGNVYLKPPGSRRNLESGQPLEDRLLGAAELVGHLIGRESGLVGVDEVVSVNAIQFSGHVYDLQSVTGLIIADSLLLSNCRCVTTLLSIEGAAKLGVKEAQEWLRTGLPPAFPTWVPWPGVALPAGWVSPFGAGGPIGLSLGDTDMALRLWDGGRLRGVLDDATGEVFLRDGRTGEVRLGYDPDEKRDDSGKWTAGAGKESRTVDVEVEGSPVSVEVNPTLQILKRWLSSPMMSSGGNTRPGRQLKAIVTDDGELYAWEAINENDEDLHHNDVAKAVGVGKHIPFEQRLEIHLQDGEPVFVTHSGVESSPKIARAAKELGAVALSFLGTRLSEGWRTIGAVDHKGGTPVHFDDAGRIDKGPASLKGKKPSELGKKKEKAVSPLDNKTPTGYNASGGGTKPEPEGAKMEPEREKLLATLAEQLKKDEKATERIRLRGQKAIDFLKAMSPEDFAEFAAKHRGHSAVLVQNAITFWEKGDRR